MGIVVSQPHKMFLGQPPPGPDSGHHRSSLSLGGSAMLPKGAAAAGQLLTVCRCPYQEERASLALLGHLFGLHSTLGEEEC